MKKKVIIGISALIVVLAFVIGMVVVFKAEEKETILKSIEAVYKPSNVIKLNSKKGYKDKDGFEKNKIKIKVKDIATEAFKIKVKLLELNTGSYLTRDDIKIGYKFSYEKEATIKKLSEISTDLAFIEGYRVFPGEEYEIELAVWLTEDVTEEKLNEKYDMKVVIERVFE